MSKLSKNITENEANLINAINAMSSDEADRFATLIRHDSKYFKYYDFFLGAWTPEETKEPKKTDD